MGVVSLEQRPVVGPTMKLSCGHWVSVMSAARHGDIYCFTCFKWVTR